MISPVPAELNLNNLRVLSALLHDLEAFVFFGTLLGYTREGNIIEHDDDIDIYVNAKHGSELIEILKQSGFKIRIWPRNKELRLSNGVVFVQAHRVQDEIDTFADFYLYDDTPAEHIVERWNFWGKWKNLKNAIHLPKEIIFPLRKAEMQGIALTIPANPEAVCEYLYGPGWMKPVKKSEGYQISIENNKPVFTLKESA